MRRRAKVLSPEQSGAVLSSIPDMRGRVMFLLSSVAGLRAVEISRLLWRMVLASDGSVGSHMELEGPASKGGFGGRVVPLHPALRSALQSLLDERDGADHGQPAPLVREALGGTGVVGLRRGSVVAWFCKLYRRHGLVGCSSHSGRRTFITRLARTIASQGGSLRDVQAMAGHASLDQTAGYIDENDEAKRLAVGLF